jgi:hypothetical protein
LVDLYKHIGKEELNTVLRLHLRQLRLLTVLAATFMQVKLCAFLEVLSLHISDGLVNEASKQVTVHVADLSGRPLGKVKLVRRRVTLYQLNVIKWPHHLDHHALGEEVALHRQRFLLNENVIKDLGKRNKTLSEGQLTVDFEQRQVEVAFVESHLNLLFRH